MGAIDDCLFGSLSLIREIFIPFEVVFDPQSGCLFLNGNGQISQQ